MEKCIVETTGDFMLLSPRGEEIHAHRPTVIVKDAFVDIKLQRGEIRVLAQKLPSEASDVDFLVIVREMTKDLNRHDKKQATKYRKQVKAAVLAYAAEYGYDAFGEQISSEKLEG